MSNQFKHLLSPITIGKVTFKNRFAVSPMGGAYGNQKGAYGEYSDKGIEYILERARGGFGLFFAGCLQPDTKVDPCDQATHFMNHQADFQKMALRLNERASFYDMKIIQQVSLGLGRNRAGLYSCSRNEVFGMPGCFSEELTNEQIKIKRDSVIQAAKLMKDSGFVGVEMHALHWGYLLDQFALAITNRRTDEYGGSLENRLRICKELVEGVKQVCGQDFLVSIRLGLKSYISGLNKTNFTGEEDAGRTQEEGIRIAKLLESYGYDLLNVDVGMYDSFYYACPPMYMPQGHVIPLAEKVKEAVNIPVYCGSRMNDPYMTEEAVAKKQIDGVVLGRQSLADPYYVKKLEMGKPDKIRPCIGCLVGCMGKLRSGEHVACAVNPTLQKEINYHLEKALAPKKVAVIGGGIAGMEAARVLKMKGHDVTIYEKTDCLGGLSIPAGAHEFKKEIKQLLEWYKGEIADLEIPVVYQAEMTAEKIKELHPDVVINAIGSKPIMPRIEGIDHAKCCSGVDALKGKVELGKKVIVVGGGLVGCETAIDLAMQGREVTIVEAAPAVLAASKMIPVMVAQMIPDLIKHYHVKTLVNYKIVGINDVGAVVAPSTGGGENQVLEADNVLMSIGLRPLPSFAQELIGEGIEIYAVGDENRIGNIYTAVASAYEVARKI